MCMASRRRASGPPARRPRRQWFYAGTAAVVLVGAGLAWLLWPSPKVPPPPRARSYLDYTACLLTGEAGIADTVAAPAWAGLQDASLTTHAKIQYLAIAGPQTVDNGVTFLNSLAQSGCNLIFAAGDIATATVDRGAAQFPNTPFYPIGGGATHANTFPISAGSPESVRTTVVRTLTAAVGASVSSTP